MLYPFKTSEGRTAYRLGGSEAEMRIAMRLSRRDGAGSPWGYRIIRGKPFGCHSIVATDSGVTFRGNSLYTGGTRISGLRKFWPNDPLLKRFAEAEDRHYTWDELEELGVLDEIYTKYAWQLPSLKNVESLVQLALTAD